MTILIIVLSVIVAAILLQAIELRQFRTTGYEIRTDKVHHTVRLLVLADLHGFSYGKENLRLLKAAEEANPDVILIAGDLVVTNHENTYQTALKLCRELIKIAPVFLAFGNHETRAADGNFPEFRFFVSELEKAGVVILNNAFSTEVVKGEELFIYGLEIPMQYYKKRVHNVLPQGFVEEKLGPSPTDRFSVLISHTPAFGDDYYEWGADLTVAGHNHGGLVRIPGYGSLISPELTFFPKHDGGHYKKDQKHLIVSKGLGTHSYHIRIFDRAELLSITIKPQS